MKQKIEQSQGFQDPVGKITLCPNGMVHLHYKGATLHFPLEDFFALLATAKQVNKDVDQKSEKGFEETSFEHGWTIH